MRNCRTNYNDFIPYLFLMDSNLWHVYKQNIHKSDSPVFVIAFVDERENNWHERIEYMGNRLFHLNVII